MSDNLVERFEKLKNRKDVLKAEFQSMQGKREALQGTRGGLQKKLADLEIDSISDLTEKIASMKQVAETSLDALEQTLTSIEGAVGGC